MAVLAEFLLLMRVCVCECVMCFRMRVYAGMCMYVIADASMSMHEREKTGSDCGCWQNMGSDEEKKREAMVHTAAPSKMGLKER